MAFFCALTFFFAQCPQPVIPAQAGIQPSPQELLVFEDPKKSVMLS